MRQATEMIDAGVLAALARRSPLRAIAIIAAQWAIIIAVAAAAIVSSNWLIWLLAIPVIATRQHALLVLMHDGAHRLLFRRPRTNDLISEFVLAFPLFVSTKLYRQHHLRHHRYLNSEQDPDLADATTMRSRGQWLATFAGDLSGMNFLRMLDSAKQFSMLSLLAGDAGVRGRLDIQDRIMFFGFLIALAIVLTLTGGWFAYAVLWLLPMITILNLLARFRAAAEHAACSNENLLNTSRNVTAGFVERAMLAPCGINYHLDHHLFPGVPCFRLKDLHARLMESASFRDHAHVNDSYFCGRRSVFAELTRAADDRAH